MTSPPFELIDSPRALDRAVHALTRSRRLYLDTEFESARSGKTLSIVQLFAGSTTRQDPDGDDRDDAPSDAGSPTGAPGVVYLIDALKLGSLGPLGELLGSGQREWVLHAGLQDVELLSERLELRVTPALFDTQLAWALLGPEASVSLAYLHYRVLGLRSMKTHQADDWMQRPLPPSQLEYAASDVAHLPALRRELGRRLRALDREHAVGQLARELLVDVEREPPPPLSLASFRNAWQLDAEAQSMLRELVRWYESLSPMAQAHAPEPKTLLAIAGRKPADAKSLLRIKGVPRAFQHSQAEALVARLWRAARAAESGDFVPLEPQPYATFPELRLEAWLAHARVEVSARAQVAPEVAFPRPLQNRLREHLRQAGATGAPALLQGWRADVLGAPFDAFCSELPLDVAR